MKKPQPDSPLFRTLIAAAAVVIIVAGLKAASGIVNQVLLGAFLAVIAAPGFLWLRSKGWPSPLALAILAIPPVLIVLFLGVLIGGSIAQLEDQLPAYEERLIEYKTKAVDSLQEMGADIPDDLTLGEFEPKRAIAIAGGAFSKLGGVLAMLMLVFFLAVLGLLESEGMAAKLRATKKSSDAMMERAAQILHNLRKYLLLKTAISAVTGVLVYVWLLILGVDFALLLGLLAFLLNYIPNIGSIIAAIPAVLLAFLQIGPGAAAGVATAYIVINVVVGNVVEPQLMGKGVGLSPLVVFLSLLFWGWVLGPIGMLLSVPLTMIFKITFEADDSTRWMAVLLGPPVTVESQ